MKNKMMKCTNTYKIIKRIHLYMTRELRAAVIAHGGRYEWKHKDDMPVVLTNSSHFGALDVRITSVQVGEIGNIEIECYDTGSIADWPLDDVTIDDVEAGHIQYIIEAIPATDEVDNVAHLFG